MTVEVCFSEEATEWVKSQADKTRLQAVYSAVLEMASAKPMPHVTPPDATDPTVAVMLTDAQVVVTVLAAPEIERLFVEDIDEL